MSIESQTINLRLRQNWRSYEARLSEIVFLGVVVIWGITFVFTRDALQVVGPFAYNTLRISLGAMTLALLAGARWRQLSRAYLWPALVTGTVLFVSYAAQSYGQQFTTASKAGFLTGTNLVYVPLLAAFLLRRAPGRSSLVGVALAFVGLILLSVQGSLGELALAPGDGWVALSGLGWAVYIIVLAYYSPKLNVMLFATLHVAFAAVMNGLAWLLVEPLVVPLNSFPLWLAVFTTGFLILGLGTSVQTWITRCVPPTRVGLIAALEPFFAGLAGWWVGESITARILLGGALIMAGVLISEFGGQRKRDA